MRELRETLYDLIHEKYVKQEVHAVIGEPGHRFVEALLSVWREREYPEEMRIGNSTLSELCGTASNNIPKLRERVIELCVVDNEQLFSYKAVARSQPGIYKVSKRLIEGYRDELLPETPLDAENLVTDEPGADTGAIEQESTRRRRHRLWNTVPFQNRLALSESKGMAARDREILDRFGIRHIRQIDRHYYIPSSQDTEILYELFRHMTPLQILEKVKSAREQGIQNALKWIGEESGIGITAEGAEQRAT